ncbi:MAG: hypothetical protein IT176_03385 [Acidobacteria bacterium]|nr:hypothetical protein [Acidobacteriota bacterium]
MGAQRVLFARRYRAALLDFLLGSGERGCERAHTLGRQALESGIGLPQIIRVHHDALLTVLEATRDTARRLARLHASHDFLTEVLSPFEMTSRGYLALARKARR